MICRSINDDRGFPNGNAYLCHTEPTPLSSTLCEPGDEGSPLLCKPHEGSRLPNNKESKPAKQLENSGNDEENHLMNNPKNHRLVALAMTEWPSMV